jgi:hypothetical protein
MELLILFVLGICALALIFWLIGYVGLPAPLGNIIVVVAALVLLLYLLRQMGFV